jgi:hypothetical protein
MFRDTFCRIVLICFLPLLLFACTSSEDKAQAEYTRIDAIEKGGDVDQAFPLYAKLAQQYPETPAGKQATAALERIARMRDAAVGVEIAKQVERLRLTLDGYNSMFGKLPASSKELDASGYFFDSKYLGEIVPAGHTTYLLLDGKDGTRIWSTRQGVASAYVAGMSGALQRVEQKQVAREIADGYRQVEQIGNLVIVARK